MAPADAPNPDPTPFDAAWLSERRWFRSKARPLRQVVVHDAAACGPDSWLLVLAAHFDDGGEARYFVPASGRPGAYREPADGAGLWRGLVARMTGDMPQLEGRRGTFRFEATPALGELLAGGAAEARALEERRLLVEQSNTSIRLGDRLMLKLYRLLEPGTNPEVEVSAFLTEAGFRHAPQAAGWVGYQADDAEQAAAAIAQALIPARGDGWDWMLQRLSAPPQGPQQALAAAAQIGGITAELHAALRSRPGQPGFPARPATRAEQTGWLESAKAQLAGATAALSGDDRRRLKGLTPQIRERFQAFEAAEAPSISRIHGDYHLGQLLAVEGGFMVTDFEGEPARSLAERRRPSSPLRDVAGMLRSLDYAARTAERGSDGGFAPDRWQEDARVALLGAYGGIGESPLLAAFELEKACYEIRYEANYRPDWVWLPLQALERLTASAATLPP